MSGLTTVLVEHLY